MENRKRSVKKYVSLAFVLLLAAGLVALPFALDRMNGGGSDGASILPATVTRADISRTVSGTGPLEAEDALELNVPEGVVLTGYAVSNGDLVKKGDIVAQVDRISVYKTAAGLAEALETVTKELAEKQESEARYQTVYSDVAGTVTAVYAEPGSDIRELMKTYGGLAEVTFDNGTVLKLTATSGIISWFFFKEGDHIYVNAPVYSYYEEEGAGNFASLVQKRQKIEDQLALLFQMYRDGYAAAPGDGMVLDVDETLVKELAFQDEGGLQVVLLSNRAANDGEPEVFQTETLYGKLTPEGNVEGIDGDVTGLPENAKPGDTVVVTHTVYAVKDEDGSLIPLPPENDSYEVLIVIPGSDSGGTGPGPGGGMIAIGGFGGISIGGGGISAGGAGEQVAEAAALPEIKIASVVPMDEVRVSITVDELDILSLHRGDHARVTLDALPGRSFEGVVTGVNTGRSNTGGNSKYTAEVTLPRSDDMLAGMNASCLVTIETFRDVLSIPAAALHDEADGVVVYTALNKDTGMPEAPVPVEVGVSDGERVEILSGLAEGETIWYSIYDTPEYSVPAPDGGSGMLAGT